MSSSGNAPVVVVLTAPSGSGKTSIAHRLLDAEPALRFSVSATTRAPRPGEQDGVAYHFLSEADFRSRIEQNELIEFEEVYPGRFYGTLRAEVDRSSPERPVLLDIDVRGAVRVKDLFGPRALAIFVRPPSVDELENRLRGRQTESDDELRDRLERARYELTYQDRFDVTVVNDDLDRAVSETIDLVRSFLEEMRAERGSDDD